MKKYLLAGFAMGSALYAAPAQAIDLVDLIDLPFSMNTPYALAFTAGMASTTVSFAGYQVPSQIDVSSVGLFANNAGPNLLAQTWTYVPAPAGALGLQVPDGAVNRLIFAGTVPGSYDVFSQTLGTTAGVNYTLSFLLSNGVDGIASPSGFRVSANVSRISPGVPEPASWAMMITGFGAIGAAMRRRRNVTSRVAFG